VVALTEWLDWGWISSQRMEDRLQWFEENAGLDCDWLAESGSKFLAEAAADEDQIVWVAPRSAQEQCGLYWFLNQTGIQPRKMIVADYPLEGAWRGESPLSLGELSDPFMAQLLDGCSRQELDISRFPLEKWRILMDDAAVLRIVEDGQLRSARPDHYDDDLLYYCPETWTKWYRVVGETMGQASLLGNRIGDLFLRWRLEELIAVGAIECQGTLPHWDAPVTTNPTRIRRAN
jgi:hypothetical protein